MNKFLITIFFSVFSIFAVFSNNVVVELLIREQDNKLFNSKNKMHMTICHLKNVDSKLAIEAVDKFNKKFKKLLQDNVSPGYKIKKFTTDGFNLGYHILEPDLETKKRFKHINEVFYFFLKDNYGIHCTEKTTPEGLFSENKYFYVPHIEFLERDKIPKSGDIIYFNDWKLTARIQEQSTSLK